MRPSTAFVVFVCLTYFALIAVFIAYDLAWSLRNLGLLALVSLFCALLLTDWLQARNARKHPPPPSGRV